MGPMDAEDRRMIRVILYSKVKLFCSMRHEAAFIGLNGSPPPTLYPVLFIYIYIYIYIYIFICSKCTLKGDLSSI